MTDLNILGAIKTRILESCSTWQPQSHVAPLQLAHQLPHSMPWSQRTFAWDLTFPFPSPVQSLLISLLDDYSSLLTIVSLSQFAFFPPHIPFSTIPFNMLEVTLTSSGKPLISPV